MHKENKKKDRRGNVVKKKKTAEELNHISEPYWAEHP